MPDGQGTKRNSLDHASEKVAVMFFDLRVLETVGKVSQIGEHLLCLKGPLSSASLSPVIWTLGPPFSWSGTRYLFLISSWQWGCVIPWERPLTRCFPASHSVPRVFSTCFTCMHAQSCPTLCDPMNYSPPGSSVHGIHWARILEWVAMPASRRSSRPRDWTCICYTAGNFFTAGPLEGPSANWKSRKGASPNHIFLETKGMWSISLKNIELHWLIKFPLCRAPKRL